MSISTPEFSFVEIEINEGVENEGNLTQVLESFVPSSIQFLNLIRMKSQSLYSLEGVESFQFLSYEYSPKSTTTSMRISERDWSDTSNPIFLLCKMRTKYKRGNNEPLTAQHIFSRETPNPEDSHLVQEFSSLVNFVDPDDFGLGVVDSRYFPFIQQAASYRGLIATKFTNWGMYLPVKEALNYASEIEDFPTHEFCLDSLDASDTKHAEIVNSHWRYGQESRIPVIQQWIKYGPSAGVWHKESGELVSFTIFSTLGTINALHTKEKWRRHGLAALTMKDICLKLARKGIYPLCEIEHDTPASKELMTKLGFQSAFDSCWIHFKPKENIS